jgi:hypothetical protein
MIMTTEQLEMLTLANMFGVNAIANEVQNRLGPVAARDIFSAAAVAIALKITPPASVADWLRLLADTVESDAPPAGTA